MKYKNHRIGTLKSWIVNRKEGERERLTELYSKKESTYQGNILDKMVTEMAKADAQKQYETKQQLNK